MFGTVFLPPAMFRVAPIRYQSREWCWLSTSLRAEQGEVRSGQVRSGQVGSGRVGSGCFGSGRVESGPCGNGSGQDRSAQLKSETKVTW